MSSLILSSGDVAPVRASIPLTCLVCIGLLAGMGCRSIKINPAPPVTSADWVTEGDSPQRQHIARGALTPPLAEAWVYNAHAGFGLTSPIIWHDVVLVGTRRGEVHAIDRTTGRKRGTEEFGEAIEGSPVLDGDVLYVPSAWGGRAVTAYNVRTGATRWRFEGPPVEAGLLILGDRLITADLEGTVRALDVQNGEALWEQALSGGSTGVYATPLAVDADQIAVADDNGQVALLTAASGDVRWTQRLPAPVYRTPATDGERLFVPTTRGRLVALDVRDGQTVWTQALPDTTVRFTAPAYRDGTVVVGTSDGRLFSLSAATGEVQWKATVGESLVATPLLTADLVYVGGMDRHLYALDARTGDEVWTYELEGRVKSPMAARDGFLVVLAEPRLVYGFTTSTDYAVTD